MEGRGDGREGCGCEVAKVLHAKMLHTYIQTDPLTNRVVKELSLLKNSYY